MPYFDELQKFVNELHIFVYIPYLIESAGAVTGRLFGASARLDGGCGARVLSSKTHIYFILLSAFEVF